MSEGVQLVELDGRRCGTRWARVWNLMGKRMELDRRQRGTRWASDWNVMGKGVEVNSMGEGREGQELDG